uniref:Aerobic-type carbon monoxide dehydrogenase, large subunit CoxL/CutL-like protein n=1 Tax=Desulfovibrio sp. U5L TaxID=596152 RepID=I2Q3D8_9BACT
MANENVSFTPVLVGQNYTTPDQRAKLTGQARYAEDFRVDGMLVAKLLLSPMPHAKVTRLNLDAARAMPGVRAILTADDLPPPADLVTDTGAVIHASRWGERALTMEPVFQGDPVLAVAAVDELTAAAAIEAMDIEFSPLPFVIDPLDSLRPGGPSARTDGNIWMRPPAKPGDTNGPPPLEVRELKWSAADFEELGAGRLPMGQAADEWSYGDLAAGFRDAALVLDESFATPNVSHQTLEPRSALAYWQNGKVFIHTGTQSTIQTVPAISRWLGVDAEKIVFISEYTGGGFGGKITASIPVIIPALLARKAGAPVMMRLSREDEHFVGRARPGLLGRMKVGFGKDGRILACDMFVIQDNGPYEQNNDASASGRIVSLIYQPAAMRWRGLAVLTNTPTRAAQTAPGGLQGITLMEPVLAKAARKLGLDQVAVRRINAPEGKAPVGVSPTGGDRPHATSAFVRQALDRGAALFDWQGRLARNDGQAGPKRRGIGVSLGCFVAGTVGFDGLFVITPEGRARFHTGVGNLGTASFSDVQRVAADALGLPWDRCEIVWGDTGKNLGWSCVSGGSQTIHAMSRAALAASLDAKRKLGEIAARTHGGAPEDYDVAGGNVVRKSGGVAMTFAEAARRAIALGGAYDGHEAPENVNKFTKASLAALAGQGLVAVAKDTFPRDGQSFSYVASFAEVEVDVETGMYAILDYLVVADVGMVVHPRALGGQILGRSMLGIGHAIGQKWAYDRHYGLPLAKRFYHTKPPTILDTPRRMAWEALGLPDPETPVGARGVGEPPTSAGCAAILNALSDALGDGRFCRAPVTADMVLASLESLASPDNRLATTF